MKYTIDDALKIARKIEPLIAPHGFHVGIAGSLVYRGDSDKDIDIIIYPHGPDYIPDDTIHALIFLLEEIEITKKEEIDTRYPIDVIKFSSGSNDVDIFFLRRKI